MLSRYLSSAGAALGLLLALCQVSQVFAAEEFTLYAYGTNVTGLPVFYADCKCIVEKKEL